MGTYFEIELSVIPEYVTPLIVPVSPALALMRIPVYVNTHSHPK